MAVKTQGLVTAEGALILASVFVNSIPLGYMSVVPLVYLLSRGYSPVTIGVIYAVSGVANTIGYTPFGVLADRFGRKRFLILGFGIPAIAYGIFGLTLDPYLLILASAIGGVGLAGGLATAISSPSVLPLLAESSPEEKRTTLFAAYQGVYTVGLSVGSFLSFLPSILESSLSQNSVTAHSESYMIMTGLVLLSVLPLLPIREGKGSVEAQEEKRSTRRGWGGSVSSWSKVAKLSLVFGIPGFGFGVIIQLLPTWYNLQFGVSEGTVGLWTAAAQLLSLVALPAIPLLVRRQGTVTVTVWSSIVSCIPLILMAYSGFFVLAASLFILRSIFISIYVPVFQSYVTGAVPRRERATVLGVVFTAWGVANSVGTVIGGDLMGANLLALPVLIGAGAYLVASVIFVFLFRGTKLPEETMVGEITQNVQPSI